MDRGVHSQIISCMYTICSTKYSLAYIFFVSSFVLFFNNQVLSLGYEIRSYTVYFIVLIWYCVDIMLFIFIVWNSQCILTRGIIWSLLFFKFITILNLFVTKSVLKRYLRVNRTIWRPIWWHFSALRYDLVLLLVILRSFPFHEHLLILFVFLIIIAWLFFMCFRLNIARSFFLSRSCILAKNLMKLLDRMLVFSRGFRCEVVLRDIWMIGICLWYLTTLKLWIHI